uniref:Uncharacterized protein n=1 Tax=Anguilla anguilla TaxID=7936 RepID=A0A0E9VT76_ANGAN
MKGLPALRTPGSGRSCFFAFEDHQTLLFCMFYRRENGDGMN